MIGINYILAKLNLSSTKEKVVSNIVWSLLGKIVTLFGNLFVSIIIARYLGDEQYGLMNYVISYVTLFQVFAMFGLDNIEVREEAKGEVSPDIIMGTAFTLKLLLGCLTFLLTVTTSFLFEADLKTTLYVAIYCISIIANSLTVIRNRFTSLVKNEFVVKSEIFRTFIGMAVKIALLLINASLVFFIAATAFDFILLGSGYIYSYHRQVGQMRNWKFSKEYARYLLRESFPLLLTNAAVYIYQRIDQVMIGNLIIDNHKSVAYFATASRFVEIIIFIPTIIAHTITPILIQIRQESQERYEENAQRFMNITFWLTFVLSTLLAVSSYWVIICTFGQEYIQAVDIMHVLAFKAAASALSLTAGALLVLEGKQKYAIVRDLFGCVVCVVLNYLLLPRYGVIAASYIAILSYVCAGYIGDLLVPAYHHLFRWQTKTLCVGWLDLVHIKKLINNR